MKCASVQSAYRNCILRASVRTARNFSPARNVRSITLPSAARRSFVRTNAPPLPGLTCWNSTILKIVPSTSMWLPFLNWLVEIMRLESLWRTRSAREQPERRRGAGAVGQVVADLHRRALHRIGPRRVVEAHRDELDVGHRPDPG